MYAFVKFTDGGRLVMPISMIKKFRPRDDQDCNPKQKLEAFWISEKGGEEGYYEATVEMLGGTVELLIQKMQKARVAVPRILNNLPEGGVGDSMQKTSSKNPKNGKQAQLIAQKKLCEDYNSNRTETSKRTRSESSESDEETNSLRQKNAVIVQLRKRLREEKEYSRRLGLALLDKIEVARKKASQNGAAVSLGRRASNGRDGFDLASTSHSGHQASNILDGSDLASTSHLGRHASNSRHGSDLASTSHSGRHASNSRHGSDLASVSHSAAPSLPQHPAPATVAVPPMDQHNAPAPAAAPPMDQHNVPAPPLDQEPVPAPAAVPLLDRPAPIPVAAPPLDQHPAPPAALPQRPVHGEAGNLAHQLNAAVQGPLRPLYEVRQGNIHLGDDVYLSETKMTHLLKLPSDQRFTKDLMRCIWSIEELRQRSVTGQASRRLAKLGAAAKQALTPRKVAAVKNALSYYINHHPNPEAANPQEDHAVRLRQINNTMTNFLSDLGRPARCRSAE
ncbi:actin cytoskeleton-regulatory complex protein PAN1 isoform X2 [Ixodes scapularis]|uniref:actin cytoskeleton-regulatory complex protein PAN1 isoform X2 n=1 Tax=Ixodes scapularis TaxID=6945 RepID=UPI001161676A|nr:actin cytoskeleton-regulatory complex protein PAN1 isoform X2 [Ixodes scapularis]